MGAAIKFEIDARGARVLMLVGDTLAEQQLSVRALEELGPELERISPLIREAYKRVLRRRPWERAQSSKPEEA